MNDVIKEILDFKENADYKRLSGDEIAILRDYITDLQEENKYLDELRNANYLSWQDSLFRIEKAVEYINNGSYFDGSSMCKVDLLNILNGRSDE